MVSDQNKEQIMGQHTAIFGIPCLPLIFFLGILSLAVPGIAAEPPAIRLSESVTTGLNLTAPQQQKLTALETASHTQADQLIMQIQRLRQKLSDLYKVYGFDVAEVRRMNQELNRVQSQLLDLRLSQQLQIRQILTPDQFAQLQAAMQRYPQQDRYRRHEPDGGRDPGGDHRKQSKFRYP